MACEAEVIRDLIPRLRGIDVPKLCGDAYKHCFKRGRESTETIQDSIAAEEREAAARVRESCTSFIPAFCVFSLMATLIHIFSQAQSVMSAKDRYLQRKAGSVSAAAPAIKKEHRVTESTTALPSASSSSSIKKEPDVAIKRE